MTTTVVGKESGRRIVVENTSVVMPAANPFYELHIQDDESGGTVATLFKVPGARIPVGLKKIVEVNLDNPHGIIWDSSHEYLDIYFSPTTLNPDNTDEIG